MERYTELLYWRKFRERIHSDKDEKEYYYYYDADIPVRARKSFENWLRENDKKQFRNTIKHNYSCERQPATTYEEALEMSLELKDNIDFCIEFENIYVFEGRDDKYLAGGFENTSVVVIKESGMIMSPVQRKQRGIEKGDQVAIHEIS